MDTILSKYWFLIMGIWCIVNGALHDIFVIRGYKGGYDRELLRLLMDGHVLILSGAVVTVCYFMANENVQYAALIALIIAIGMLVYCAMIFPFLKSIGTMVIATITLATSIKLLITN